MVLARSMSWLISFVWVKSICEERKASENYKIKKALPTVGFNPPIFRSEVGHVNYWATEDMFEKVLK